MDVREPRPRTIGELIEWNRRHPHRWAPEGYQPPRRMAEPASKLTDRLRAAATKRARLRWQPEEMNLLREAASALEQAHEDLAREIELRIEDEPIAVRRQAQRAERAEAALEQAKKALQVCLDGHRDYLSLVDSGDCYCSRCQLARETLAVLAGQDKQETT